MKLLTPLIISLIVFSFGSIQAQVYEEIPIDTSEHFNITLEPGITYYFSTLAACNGQAYSTVLGFLDDTGAPIDYVDVTIDDVLPYAIVPPYIVYIIRFNISLKSNAPPPGTISGICMVSAFQNSSGNVVGGYVRCNMSFTIVGTTATNDLYSQIPSIDIFPNPSTGVFHLLTQHEIEPCRLTLFDMQGQVVWNDQWDNPVLSQKEIDIAKFPNGLYLLRLYGKDFTIAKTLQIQR